MALAIDRTRRQRVPTLVILGALTVAGCALGATEQMKSDLTRHGSIDGEWEVRDEGAKKTHTYVILRTTTGIHETYEIVATDGQRAVTREQVGGIDRTGCFLTPFGLTTPWVMQKPPETLQDTRKSGDDTRTKCLEYKETAGWNFIPAADRKAAEPPPPPPPAPGPDAGTASPDGGMSTGGEKTGAESESKGGEVKSALGL